jgi:DDE superfamily endonuclease
MPPDRGLTDKQRFGVKGNKVRLTYAFTSNVTGSEKLPPIVIGKAKKPRAFQKKTGTQLGFYYRNNAKAWMTATLYQEWLERWDHELKKDKRKILLLQDNFSAHIPPEGLENIRVENFHPNLTAHVQPMDQGIIRCFKAHYRSKFIQRAIDNYDAGVTPSKIYDIDQLQAMRLADAAWHDVDATTIRHCWHKAAILPGPKATAINPAIPISALLNNDDGDAAGGEDLIKNAEQDVEMTLDGLQSKGVLQAENRMSIEMLLNPVDERHIIDETTDEEICEAVLEAHRIEEDVEERSEDVIIEVGPTRCEALKAAMVVNRYIETIDDPFARKLEAVLASFGRQLQLEAANSTTPTYLTDHFGRK